MSTEALLLLATGLLAVVAVLAALVAVRAVRRLDRAPAPAPVEQPEPAAPIAPVGHAEPATVPVRIVEGRVIATPTEQQVVAAALGRPAVRLSVYAAGLAHALRPESRDRIAALMRREYRRRRRVRQQVARRAARAVPSQALRHRDDSWLGTLPGTAEPLHQRPRAVGE